MGIRIAIGAIIAVLLGGTGYLAQQSHSVKNLLQKRESELSKEKDSSAKLKSDILRFKTKEQQMMGLQSRLEKEGTSAKTRLQEMSRLIAEKSASIEQEKAKTQNLEAALTQIQTTLASERKARAEVEKSNQQNIALAGNRAEEIKRLETQAQEMSRLVAEKSTGIEQEKTEIRNLKTTLDILNSSLDHERKARAEVEKSNQQNIALAGNRAEEIKRLETQAQKMSHLVAEKSAGIKQEKTKTQNLEAALKQIQTSLENERKTRADVEKSNKQNLELAANRAEEIKRLETQAQEMSRLVAEKSADIELEKTKAQNLERALKQIQTSLENERKTRADMEKSNKQNLELAASLAEETKRLEEVRALLQTQVVKMRQLITNKSADIEQEKAKTQNLESALKRIQTTLETERKMRAEAEKSSKQNLKIAGKRAEEIQRLEKARGRLDTQVGKMRQLIAEKSADIEQEKTKTQNLEHALEQIQAALETERKTRAKIEKSSKRNLELAKKQAEEIKRLEKVRGILETQVLKMDQLIAAEQEKATKRNLTDERKAPAKAKAEKSNVQTTKLASNQAEEMKRLEKTREILNTQVQEMNRLITEKNASIEQEKAKARNLALALEQIRTTLVDERKTRTKAEKSNAQNAELARNRADEINQLQKARELLGAQVQEMSQLIAEKTSVAELIKNKLNQTNLSLSETIKKHTLAIARSKILEKKAQEEAERSQKLASDLNEMNSRLKKQSITLERTKDLLRVTFVNSLLFDSGSARLREKGLEALSSVAEFLQKQEDKVIRVEGHTDNRLIRGNLLGRYPSNWELSFARAVSIVKFLESKNISPARMSATGYSFYRPVASNDTEKGRTKNRRTDILLSSHRSNVEAATP